MLRERLGLISLTLGFINLLLSSLLQEGELFGTRERFIMFPSTSTLKWKQCILRGTQKDQEELDLVLHILSTAEIVVVLIGKSLSLTLIMKGTQMQSQSATVLRHGGSLIGPYNWHKTEPQQELLNFTLYNFSV
jgi:hypothetical protein